MRKIFYITAAVGAFLGGTATAGAADYNLPAKIPGGNWLGGVTKFDPIRPGKSRFNNKIARRRGKKRGAKNG